jgi:hypothetical protein
MNRKVTTYERHRGGREVREEIIPPVVIGKMRLFCMQKLHSTIRTEIHRKTKRITGRETSEEHSGGDHTLFTSERHGGPASSFQALIDTNTEMEMLEIAQKIYWIIKAK